MYIAGKDTIGSIQPSLNASVLIRFLCVQRAMIILSIEFHLRQRFRYFFLTGLVCAVATLVVSLPVVLWLLQEWFVAVSALLNGALKMTYWQTLSRERAGINFTLL